MQFHLSSVKSSQHYTFAEAVIRTSHHDEKTVLLRCLPNAIRGLLYEDYYMRQSEGEVPVFYGARTQKGHGLGSILGGLFRRALPFLSSGAKILGQQAMNVASGMIDSKSFQDSAKSRLKEGIKTFVTSNRSFVSLVAEWEGSVAVSLPGSSVKSQKRRGLQIFFA